ncbi:hypothetical protein WA026_021474 [Henosepilachna vigintioctopunctata]|uniref:Uncharacterized protein n=1 Tax=Henosepilachna vigintioctopunctata TaxID=420089 RepID=A0AAW1UID5_9CUCU
MHMQKVYENQNNLLEVICTLTNVPMCPLYAYVDVGGLSRNSARRLRLSSSSPLPRELPPPQRESALCDVRRSCTFARKPQTTDVLVEDFGDDDRQYKRRNSDTNRLV